MVTTSGRKVPRPTKAPIMFSSWLADSAAIVHHAENHGLIGYLGVIAVLTAGLAFIIPQKIISALVAGYREALRQKTR